MLLLESLDLPQRSVSFLAHSTDRLRVRDEFARMAELSAGLGFRDLVLHFANSGGGFTQIEAYVGPEVVEAGPICLGAEPFPISFSPGSVATLPRIEVQGRIQDGMPSYEINLEACAEARPLLDAGLALVLATWGQEDRPLRELRTALFEIGAHYLDHTEDIRLRAAGPCADQILLRMDFREDLIRGHLEDDGPAFDPSGSAKVHLRSNDHEVAREIGWFCRLLDEFAHEHRSAGNRIDFHKRLRR